MRANETRSRQPGDETMQALEAVMSRIDSMGTEMAYAIVRQMGGGWLPSEHERMVRAAAYQVIENRLGTDALDALMDEVDPGWRN
jgi:hypothetical protein